MEPESACSFYSCRVFNHWRISVRLLIKSFRKSLVFSVSESKGPTDQLKPLGFPNASTLFTLVSCRAFVLEHTSLGLSL